MFINKLNQIYKPERTLYYLDPTQEELNAFLMGTVPEIIEKNMNAFGTYDYPGVFFLPALARSVIGIEYRPNDERIKYPEGLKTITLPECFFYTVELDEELVISKEAIDKLYESLKADDDAYRIYSDFYFPEELRQVCAFSDYRKTRILFEIALKSEIAKQIIEDDAEAFEKSYLYKSAYYDFVTGHYNWNHLVSYLEMPMKANIQDYSFVHFDIKEFRVLNEVYGHIAANVTLCKVVQAMQEADFVYASGRCHNDNFAMMIKDMPEAETIATLEAFFEKLSHLKEDPNYRINFRCGVVPMQRSMLSGNRVADAAKLAQSLGNSRSGTEIIIYTDKMHDDISWSNYIKAYVETAIKDDEFVVYLQPKFDIHTEKAKGAEALIRWNYKKREYMPPSRFIPFFEKDGTIGKIDDIVLEKVCATIARWKREGKPTVPISVNLSRKRLYEARLTEHLTEIVDRYGVDHELIDFELTESATYDNMERMLEVLEDLRSRGFKISMDDFGTGYSSLSLLTRMPIDTLKIDKSFVDNVFVGSEHTEDIVVIKHIIELAKELGFVCLAEGAESKAQVDKLRTLGCELIQGYYYSVPVSVQEFEEKYL